MKEHEASIHANHLGTSFPKPEAVHAAVSRALRLAPPAAAEEYERSVARVAAAFGVRDLGRFQITSGCTAALSLVLPDLPWHRISSPTNCRNRFW